MKIELGILYDGRKIERSQVMSKCTCLDWINSMHLIVGAQMLAWSHGALYKGEPFVFCPWCGKKLESE